MVNSIRKVDFSHPTGHYTWTKFSPPPLLEKILGAPLVAAFVCTVYRQWRGLCRRVPSVARPVSPSVGVRSVYPVPNLVSPCSVSGAACVAVRRCPVCLPCPEPGVTVFRQWRGLCRRLSVSGLSTLSRTWCHRVACSVSGAACVAVRRCPVCLPCPEPGVTVYRQWRGLCRRPSVSGLSTLSRTWCHRVPSVARPVSPSVGVRFVYPIPNLVSPCTVSGAACVAVCWCPVCLPCPEPGVTFRCTPLFTDHVSELV